jgi:crotonobetainyl-CoA:carnitine CoA-transferase CaiB-like acyl-CoA transferase
MPGPMDGVRVVELGVWIAGPATGGILGDWGADVIKLEPPGVGDPSRTFGAMFGADLAGSPPYEMDSRNKRSIALDLQTEAGIAVALELIDRADVFVSNLRPGSLARLGLDPDSLLERNPRLIYAAVTGFGLEGPDADRAAYDIGAFWARSGVANALTRPGEAPPFQRGGMGDHQAGLSGAAAVSAALYSREKTGKGQLVSTSLLRQGIYMLSFDYSFYLRFGAPIAAADRKAFLSPTINSYQDKDGRWFWLIGLQGERHWPPLCRAVGREEWLDDERFATPMGRAMNAVEMIAKLDEIFATKTRDAWGKIFDAEQDMWWAPVQNAEEVIGDPQVTAAGGWVEVPDGAATTTLPASPVDFHGTPGEQRWMAPALGQHTDEVLAELGRSASDIARLRGQGVVS